MVSRVLCSTCGELTAKKTARQRIVSWTLSHSGEGTMTAPQCVEQTGEFECPPCFARRRYGMAARPAQEEMFP